MDKPRGENSEDLAALIRQTAARVRARDFIWSAAITAGILIVVAFTGLLTYWWLAPLAWFAFIAALLVRYRFSSGRAWALPVQRVIESEMAAQSAEIARLRLARGIARALPEPLFILDAAGMIEGANPAAEEFVEAPVVEGKHFAAVMRAPSVFEAVEAVANGEPPGAVDFTLSGSIERFCRAYVAPLREEGDHTRVLVFVRDLTSEKRVEQMRADFVASASHELRTPLASLLGFIETLRGHAKSDPEAQEKFLGIMQTQAERMQRLVADLMSLSRIELNEHVPPRGRVNLAAVADDVIESTRPIFEGAEAIVDFSGRPERAVEVLGDADEITQAIQNLIDNALKYGGEPPMVKISVGIGQAPPLGAEGEIAYRAGETVEVLSARQNVGADAFAYVQVRDFGAGIERAVLPRLTERFYRVNLERSRQTGGTGLGLAIVKHIANRHKGGLQIESRLGAGTAFTCYFPRAPQR